MSAFKPETTVTSMYDQAVQTFGEALKAGVKTQQDIVKWWGTTLDQATSVQDFQKRSQAFVNEAIPAAQKNTQEYLRVAEANYRRAVELLKRACSAPANGESPEQANARTRELWEASVNVVQENTQAIADANLKVIDAWAGVLKKNFNGCCGFEPRVGQTVGAGAKA
jgi:hypothetical protein